MQAKKLKEKNKEKHTELQRWWDTIKHTNIHVIGVAEGGGQKWGKKLFGQQLKISSIWWKTQLYRFKKLTRSQGKEVQRKLHLGMSQSNF